jgi:hypothetical protein
VSLALRKGFAPRAPEPVGSAAAASTADRT